MSYKKHHFNTQYSTTGVYAKATCITIQGMNITKVKK